MKSIVEVTPGFLQDMNSSVVKGAVETHNLEESLKKHQIVLGWALQMVTKSTQGALTIEEMVELIAEFTGLAQTEAEDLYADAVMAADRVPATERSLTINQIYPSIIV